MRNAHITIFSVFLVLVTSNLVFAAVGPSYSTPYAYPTPADKCVDVVCEQVSKFCPDGFLALCAPTCDSNTGKCGICVLDCSGHETPSSDTNLKCSELRTARERIKCRINLPFETELNYLPEECRELAGLQRARCVTNYQTVQRCFEFENDVAKVDCAKKNLVLTIVAEEKSKCANNTTCIDELKGKVFDLVKFRIYNLEYKAQELKEKGVSEELILDFITAAEQKKVEFNNAQTIAEKKQIVQDVIKLWKDFVKKGKEQVRK